MYNERELSIKGLPLKLRKNGFNYTRVLGVGDCYIYEQDCNLVIEYNEPGVPKIIYYEVFRVRIRHAETINGKEYPAREVFPRDEDFGYTAWSIHDLDQAILKLMQLKGHIK